MLTRIALRIAAVEALKGATLVGSNVLDSEIGAIDIAADGRVRTDEDKPFIAIYTDDSKVDGDIAGRSLHKSGPLNMVLEYGVTAAMTMIDDETGESSIVAGIPATDAGLEWTLDLIGYQISATLSDPENEWAELWRSLGGNTQKIERKRTADASGTRTAAHQMTITVDLMPDPIRGDPLRATATMARFFAKAQAAGNPVLLKQVLAMQTTLAGGVSPDWKLDMRRYGLTDDEACKMLLKPVSGAADIISEVAIDDPAHAS